MDRPNCVTGRIWVLTDAHGRLFSDVDTDMIFHNRHLHLTDVAEMGQYALGNLEGWQDLAQRIQKGDIIVAGRNFGSGSSRQQAVDCFRALGVTALVAESFGAIYFRNAVNAGWPVLVCPALDPAALNSGDEIELDLAGGTWRNLTRGTDLPALKAVSNVQREIMAAGGLFKLATG